MVASLLDREIYSYGDIDRLVGLHPGTARRWLDGYSRGDRFYEPVLREQATGSDAVTWGEMVEARLLAEFRSKKVSLQRLRPAIVRLREEFGPYPLAHARPFLDVEGRELVLNVQDSVGLDEELYFVVLRNGQTMITEATDRFRSSVQYNESGVVRSLQPERRTPAVVMDPARTFGQPMIRNVRTDVLAEDFRAGTSREEIAEFYDLTAEQVDEALRFELITRSDHAA